MPVGEASIWLMVSVPGPYLEGQGDLVNILITPISQIITPDISILTPVTKST